MESIGETVGPVIMAINIESAETEELARRVAELTGESLTDAITNALRERLARLTRHSEVGLAERLMRIGAACAATRSGKGHFARRSIR
jgi:antitoxin VapB